MIEREIIRCVCVCVYEIVTERREIELLLNVYTTPTILRLE